MKNTFKSLSLSDCHLQPSRIDIWQYPLHTEFSGAADLLNDAESARAQRYHFPRHQRRYTVARATMRLILARYLNSPPSALIFSYGKHGKPALEHVSSLQFNLSHSGELALLAVGQNYPLGIDLEFFSARPYVGIGEHLFSKSEMQALRQANPRLKPLVFFHIWAQKEAFIKACGLGLSYPTKEFDVPALPPVNHDIADTLNHKTWKLVSFMPEIACSGALCYNPCVQEIRYLKLDNCASLLGSY